MTARDKGKQVMPERKQPKCADDPVPNVFDIIDDATIAYILSLARPFVPARAAFSLTSRRFAAIARSPDVWCEIDIGRELIEYSLDRPEKPGDVTVAAKMLFGGDGAGNPNLTRCRTFTGFVFAPIVTRKSRHIERVLAINDVAWELATLSRIANPEMVRVFLRTRADWTAVREVLAGYTRSGHGPDTQMQIQLRSLWIYVDRSHADESHGPGVAITTLRSLTYCGPAGLLVQMCTANPWLESITIIEDKPGSATIDTRVLLGRCPGLQTLRLVDQFAGHPTVVVDPGPAIPVMPTLTTLSIAVPQDPEYAPWISACAPNLTDVTLALAGNLPDVANATALADISELRKLERLSLRLSTADRAAGRLLECLAVPKLPGLVTFEAHYGRHPILYPDIELPGADTEDWANSPFKVDIAPVLAGRAVRRLVSSDVVMYCDPDVFAAAVRGGLDTIVYRVERGKFAGNDVVSLVSRDYAPCRGMRLVLPNTRPPPLSGPSCITELEITHVGCIEFPRDDGPATVLRTFPHIRTVTIRGEQRGVQRGSCHGTTSSAVAAKFLRGSPCVTVSVFETGEPRATELRVVCVRPVPWPRVDIGRFRLHDTAISDALGCDNETPICCRITIEYQ